MNTRRFQAFRSRTKNLDKAAEEPGKGLWVRIYRKTAKIALLPKANLFPEPISDSVLLFVEKRGKYGGGARLSSHVTSRNSEHASERRTTSASSEERTRAKKGEREREMAGGGTSIKSSRRGGGRSAGATEWRAPSVGKWPRRRHGPLHFTSAIASTCQKGFAAAAAVVLSAGRTRCRLPPLPPLFLRLSPHNSPPPSFTISPSFLSADECCTISCARSHAAAMSLLGRELLPDNNVR